MMNNTFFTTALCLIGQLAIKSNQSLVGPVGTNAINLLEVFGCHALCSV